jgi:hypothetical protein
MEKDFEQNRKELLETIGKLRKDGSGQAGGGKDTVILFGAKSPFMDALVQTVEKKYPAGFFDDPEQAAARGLESSPCRVIIDMDPPTDWKMATDVFTTIKTVRPDAGVFLCTSHPDSDPVKTLAAQKGIVLVKPFSADLLFRKIKEGR